MSRPAPARTRIPRHGSFHPWWFLALTLGWTWVLWWSAVWSGGSWNDPLTFVLFALGGSGPLLSAALLLRIAGRPEDELDFWRRLLDVRLLRARGSVLVMVLNLLGLSFVYAALYFATGRSILAVVVLHAAANAAGELVSAPGARTAETVVVLAMAAVAVIVLVRRDPSRPNHASGARGVAPRTGGQ